MLMIMMVSLPEVKGEYWTKQWTQARSDGQWSRKNSFEA